MNLSELSKKVGWERREVAYPTLEAMQALLARVEKKEPEAYEEALTLHRFLSVPTTAEHAEVIALVHKCYTTTVNHLK